MRCETIFEIKGSIEVELFDDGDLSIDGISSRGETIWLKKDSAISMAKSILSAYGESEKSTSK